MIGPTLALNRPDVGGINDQESVPEPDPPRQDLGRDANPRADIGQIDFLFLDAVPYGKDPTHDPTVRDGLRDDQDLVADRFDHRLTSQGELHLML